jgi:hypothetical protein
MSNEDQLRDAGIIKTDDALSPEQRDAIESLSEEELRFLTSSADRQVGEVLVELRSRITHRVED